MSGLCIYVMGGFHATYDCKPLLGLRSVKAQAVVAYLALHRGKPVSRRELLHLFWPGYAKATASASLRTTLSNLRSVLGTSGELTIDRYAVTLSDFWCDVYDGNICEGAILLAGYEGIDSQPFIEWLNLLRRLYNNQGVTINNPRALAESVQNALALLARSGHFAEAAVALLSLGELLTLYGMFWSAEKSVAMAELVMHSIAPH